MKRFIAIYLPLKDLKQLRHIAVFCLGITPLVGIEADITKAELNNSLLKRGLILDISGTKLLYPSESELSNRISKWLDQNNIKHKLAFGSSIGAAWALSRFEEPLPLGALRITAEEIKSIQDVGIETLAELLKLPFKDIGHRFGLNVYKRVNQLLGTIEEPLRYIKLSEEVSIRRKFETAISNKATVSRWVNLLLEDLLKKNKHKASKPSTFMLSFTLENGECLHKNVSLYLASDEFSHVSSVIQTSIDTLKFKFGVLIIKITALDFRFEVPLQASILESNLELQDKERSIGEYLNSVSSKIGAHNIKKAIFCPSYLPEKSFLHIPVSSKTNPQEIQYITDRPSKLFIEPIGFEAISMLPDSPPTRITLKGRSLRILKGLGPERINFEWWNNITREAVTYRDYFKLLDEKGRRLWVYRESESMNWFLHGIWI